MRGVWGFYISVQRFFSEIFIFMTTCIDISGIPKNFSNMIKITPELKFGVMWRIPHKAPRVIIGENSYAKGDEGIVPKIPIPVLEPTNTAYLVIIQNACTTCTFFTSLKKGRKN